MDLGQLAVAFVSGGAVTAVLTASHQRTERFRDRLLEAAEAFIEASDRAWDAAIDYGGTNRRSEIAWIQLDFAIQQITKREETITEAKPQIIGELFGLVTAVLQDFPWQMVNVGASPGLAADRSRLQEMAVKLRGTELPLEWDGIRNELREVIRCADEVLERGSDSLAKGEQSLAAVRHAQATIPRIALLFPDFGWRRTGVLPAATRLAGSLRDAYNALREMPAKALESRTGVEPDRLREILDEARSQELHTTPRRWQTSGAKRRPSHTSRAELRIAGSYR